MKLETKIKKIERLWAETYNILFDDPRIKKLATPLFLDRLKQYITETQIEDFHEHIDIYENIPLSDFKKAMNILIKKDGIKQIKELVKDIRIEFPDEDHWEA